MICLVVCCGCYGVGSLFGLFDVVVLWLVMLVFWVWGCSVCCGCVLCTCWLNVWLVFGDLLWCGVLWCCYCLDGGLLFFCCDLDFIVCGACCWLFGVFGVCVCCFGFDCFIMCFRLLYLFGVGFICCYCLLLLGV